MNSRDILINFLTDASFSEACTAEKFSRECAASLAQETALKLYSLIAEQHRNTLDMVKNNVNKGGYSQIIPEIGKNVGFTPNSSHNSATISYLMSCLTDAIEKGEVQSDLLSKEISEGLKAAENSKLKLSKLASEFHFPDQEPGRSTSELAGKCISVLRRDGT